jgi:hypothetical protein
MLVRSPKRLSLKNKKSPNQKERGFIKIRRRHTLPDITPVPSAQAGLTSLFEMGRGGHCRYSHLKEGYVMIYHYIDKTEKDTK